MVVPVVLVLLLLAVVVALLLLPFAAAAADVMMAAGVHASRAQNVSLGVATAAAVKRRHRWPGFRTASLGRVAVVVVDGGL